MSLVKQIPAQTRLDMLSSPAQSVIARITAGSYSAESAASPLP